MNRDVIDRLPKAELHVHLEGTLEPQLLLDLAARNKIPVPWSSAGELREEYAFSSLEHFLSLLFRGAQVLRQAQDFYDLTRAYLARAARDQVRRAEVFFGSQTFLDAGVPISSQLDGIFAAIDDARTDFGVSAEVILTSQRHRPNSTALELVELTLPWHHRILGFGLSGAERNNPPSKFVDYFALCRRMGFRTTIHAGEDGPSSYVREALDLCHADRIDHGVSAAEDPDLVARLRDEQIPLTMCPLSNRQLMVTPDLATHPLAQLHNAGVMVTVNSDDPPYFGGYINDNYRAVRDALGLTSDELAALAINSFTASFADQTDIDAGATEVHAVRAGQ